MIEITPKFAQMMKAVAGWVASNAGSDAAKAIVAGAKAAGVDLPQGVAACSTEEALAAIADYWETQTPVDAGGQLARSFDTAVRWGND